MKSLLLIGGLLGFAIGLGFSWAHQSAWPALLWHACGSTCLAGLLMKWWGRAWRKNLGQSLRDGQSGVFLNTSTLSKSTKP
ncbi:MAG: hypothetical protein ABJC04_09710 [Verrucomicrobiota bacterium]